MTHTKGLGVEHEEVLAPLVELRFDYDGTVVRANDERTRLFRGDGGGLATIERDVVAEGRARAVLERLGALDLACVEDIVPVSGCDADYVVRIDGDAHVYCTFTSNLLAQLRSLGWACEVAADYPFRVAPADVPWFATVEPAPELPDWFSLELGVEVEGQRIDLLPLIVQMLTDADEAEGLRALERSLRPTHALKLNDTHHVTLSTERLRALVRVVIELYQGVRTRGPSTILFPAVRAAALDRLDSAMRATGTKVALKDPARVVEKGRAVRSPVQAIQEPPTLRASLRPYQRDGVAFLQHMQASGVGCVLADDMGLGKTLQTIAHLCLEKEAGRMTAPALVIGPTSLVGNWARELSKFAPHLRVLILHGPQRHARAAEIASSDVVLTTYPLLVRDEERLARERFHVVILDEAQAIKNVRSQAHRALRSIQADHHICLTGTPVENHLGELWAIFDFLAPGLLGDELRFRRWYKQPIEQMRDEERLAALREQVSPHLLRRVKRDVAKELPPKTELLHPVELAGEQRELYENIRVAAHTEVRKVIRSKGLAASALPILDALMKLRQVCCDPRLVSMDAARQVRGSAKYEAFFALLDEQLAAGHRVLVFSQFTSMLALLANGLREQGRAHLILTGATRERQRVVDAFEEGRADVFLISLKAGGTGLNLTSADTVVHYDPWWNPAAQAQATDRAYRIGQQRPVFVYNLFASGSVEERVLRLQQRKRWLSTGVLGDAEVGSALGEHDVDALFAPLDDAS
ncbi:MAG TPA: DEAD/DEAH box helicase [Polyangiaceae bacterium]